MNQNIKIAILSLLCLFLIQPILMSQTDNDGNMRIIVSFTETYFHYAGSNIDDTAGDEEHNIRFYARDRGDVDNASWRGGATFSHNCQGECYWNHSDYWAMDNTYGSTVPTQYDLRYVYWEDDCYDCFRCTSTFLGVCTGWSCDQCSRTVYNGSSCSCSGNILCGGGCNGEDRLYDITLNGLSIRDAAPGWTFKGYFDGDFSSNSDRPVTGISVYWTPPRPDFALANGQSGSITICQGQSVSLSTAGAEWNGIYRWRTSGGTFVGDGNPITVTPASTTTYRVWTRNGSLQSISYRDVTVNVNPTTYVWTGDVSTDWNNPGNWSCNTVPNASSNVNIPQGRPRYPVISNSFTGVDAYCNTITLDITGGASLQVNTGVDFSITQ